MSRTLVPAAFWFALSECAGAVDATVRVSDRSFTGWVVEPIFQSYESASEFARRASGVLGVGVVVRRWVPVSWRSASATTSRSVTFTQPWACSLPCEAPGRVLSLAIPSRGSRAVIQS